MVALGVAWAATGHAATELTCQSLDSLVDCAPADVGEACGGGGVCVEIACRGADAGAAFKCSCSPGLGVPDGGCPSAPKDSGGCNLAGHSSRDINLGALAISGAAAMAVLVRVRRRNVP